MKKKASKFVLIYESFKRRQGQTFKFYTWNQIIQYRDREVLSTAEPRIRDYTNLPGFWLDSYWMFWKEGEKSSVTV